MFLLFLKSYYIFSLIEHSYIFAQLLTSLKNKFMLLTFYALLCLNKYTLKIVRLIFYICFNRHILRILELLKRQNFIYYISLNFLIDKVFDYIIYSPNINFGETFFICKICFLYNPV